MITAPYNFVPLNEKVFFPPWAEYVSHDIPFEDGESGEIEIVIEAKSPIFIRDSKNKEKFYNYDGKYYIPGSSIKGMIRNVLEIMSFSKMSFIDDTTYSVRDLKYKKYMEKSKNVQCGWLFYDSDEKLKIEDCREPYRIKYDDIERKFPEFKKEYFMNGIFSNANSPYKKAYKKYNLINEDIINTTYKFSSCKIDKTGRKIVNFEDNGQNIGKLVLTGHPSARKEPQRGKASGKIYDFVFIKKEKPQIYEVTKKVFENFKFAYFDGRDTQPKESPDWTFWKQRLNSGEKVPVFFHKNTTGVSSFGLSYLYKFPYEKSVMKALLKAHTSNEIDLAESIMGFSKKIDHKQISLKGRVQFSHAKQLNNAVVIAPRNILLGSPKASYYPIYLVQNGGEYKTLMDGDAVLAGWKRYPIHKNFNHNNIQESTQATKITPLGSGAKFSSKIRLHNLKKVEIGALLSALTFHKTEECYHSIGLGKPYGYGKIKVKITNMQGLKYSQEEYLKCFEACMNSEIFDGGIRWCESEQIVNLFTMATEQNDSNLEYMELVKFAKEKNKKEDGSYEYLDRYVNLDGVIKKYSSSLIDKEDIQNYNKSVEIIRKINEDRKKKKEADIKAKIEKQKINEEYKRVETEYNSAINSNDLSKLKSFRDRYPDFEKIEIIKTKIQSLENSLKNDIYKEINEKAKRAYEALQKKKSNQKQYNKEKEKFIKKWSASKNNKNSEYILKLVKKIKNER